MSLIAFNTSYNIQYFFFLVYAWLISLSIMSPRFICVRILFLSLNNTPLYVYITFCLSVHLSMDTWMSMSWHLWIWVYKYLFEMLLLVLLGIYLKVELSDYFVITFIFFSGTITVFLHSSCTVLHSNQQRRGASIFLQPCQHLFSDCFEVWFYFDSSSGNDF